MTSRQIRATIVCMSKVAIAALVLVGSGLTVAGVQAAPAQAATYSANTRLGAHMLPVRTCFESITVYRVELTNESRWGAYFRSYEVMNGQKVVSEHKEWTRVAPHSTRRLQFIVAEGEKSQVVVTFRDEVLVARKIEGVCFA